MESTAAIREHVSFDSHSTKRVSFVLTTKNRAERVAQTLETARGYVTAEDEFIVVDGGSTDGTLEVLAGFSDLVELAVSESDVGAGHAVNKGILLANGRYIRHVTDDDVLYRDGLERAVEVLDANPDVDLLVCGGTKQMGHMRWDVWLPPGVGYGRSPEGVFRYGASGAGFVIRRSAISRMGLQPIGPAGDTEYVLQAMRAGAAVRFCRIKLYYHTIHEQSYVVRLEEEHGRHRYELAKTYLSKGSYYRYWLGQAMKSSYLARRLRGRFLQAGAAIRQVLPAFLAGGPAGRPVTGRVPEADPEVVWDGGFS